jgi:hypothetical protein
MCELTNKGVWKNGTSRADKSLPASPDSNPIGAVVGGDKQQGGEASSARELRVWEASLEDQAGALSRWTLSYLNPLLRLGASKVLDADDIGVVSKQDQAEQANRTNRSRISTECYIHGSRSRGSALCPSLFRFCPLAPLSL